MAVAAIQCNRCKHVSAMAKPPVRKSPSPETRSHKQSSTSHSLGSRAQLVSAALDIILERGVDALRIDEVSDTVGLSKGSIYWHFKDRHGLIRAALAEQIERLSAETIVAVSDAITQSVSKDDYFARIMPYISDPFDTEQVRVRWQRLAVLVGTQNDPELREMMREVQVRHLDVVVELMSEAQEHGLLRSDLDPRAVAAALSVINLGSTIIDVLGSDGPTPEAWWSLIGFFLNTMFPEQKN